MMPMSAWACDAAGENTHIGQVLSSDGDQFTIRDAQSGAPINFTSAAKMKGSMPAAGDRVAVKYSEGDKGLVAESVR
ncbi:MAG: hypothetical protein JKY87_04340 [Mariprofundus sp.]|nr:hypothetical protein [Mariprofundus sp.]